MRLFCFASSIAWGLFLCTTPVSAATVVADFSGGVTAVNHPNPADGGSNEFGVWYDLTNDTFGTPSAGTLSGSPAMLITDGGFTNGVYAIFQSAVPATGLYTLSADVLVNDTATSQMTNYQLGVQVNGVHRGPNPSDVAVFTGSNAAVANYTGLTSGALDATTTQTLVTPVFSANAGANLLVGFGTSLDVLDFDTNAGFWNQATVLVDNIMLNRIPEPTTIGFVVLGLGFQLLCFRRVRGR